MFNKNNEEKKLDWMYKGANSLVEREEYLLGRSVDKTLEQLNEEDKQKQQGVVVPPKNRVEYECIPPSIRDFNKVVQAEQVDLSAKLQEDPLVTIKKREEESRKQFLQNPVQLKKLQKALDAQQIKKKKKKKKKKSDDRDADLDVKLVQQLLGKKKKKPNKEERNLDTILIHKYEEYKDQLTKSDLQDILAGKITDESDSEEEEDEEDNFRKKSRKKGRQYSPIDKDSSDEKHSKKYRKEHHQSSSNTDEKKIKKSLKKRQDSSDSESSNEEEYKEKDISQKHKGSEKSNSYHRGDRRQETQNWSKHQKSKDRGRHGDRNEYSHNKNEHSQRYRHEDEERRKRKHKDSHKKDKDRSGNKSKNRDSTSSSSEQDDAKYDGNDSDYDKNKKINYGLVNADGKKLRLSKYHDHKETKNKPRTPELPPPIKRNRAKELTEEEKEKRRLEMMQNAVRHDKERSRNVKKYREDDKIDKKVQDFDSEFIHKQLIKSSQTSCIESRIKSKLNNIQRSSRDMDRNFSRR